MGYSAKFTNRNRLFSNSIRNSVAITKKECVEPNESVLLMFNPTSVTTRGFFIDLHKAENSHSIPYAVLVVH